MSIYPTLRYTDAKAAIAFLTSAFGLTEETLSIVGRIPQTVGRPGVGSSFSGPMTWSGSTR